MTLPTLVQNYKKKVLETRITKFVSVYTQAVRMAEAEHGPMADWQAFSKEPNADEITNTGEDYLEYYNKYMGKYLKTTSYKVLPDGVAFALADGSGFIFYYNLKFCVDFKKCLAVIDKANADGSFAAKNGRYIDGKNTFAFGIEGRAYNWKWDGTDANLINHPEFGCREGNKMPLYCSKMLEVNGWKVPDNYPIKL